MPLKNTFDNSTCCSYWRVLFYFFSDLFLILLWVFLNKYLFDTFLEMLTFDNPTCCSQEKAYWRVYRPPPGYNTLVENSPVPTRWLLRTFVCTFFHTFLSQPGGFFVP